MSQQLNCCGMCKFINWSDHHFSKYTNNNYSKILIMSILTIWVTVSSLSKLGTREHSRWCRINSQWSVKLSAHSSRRPCWIWGVWGRHARMQPYQMIYQFVGHALVPANITDIPLIKSAPEHDYCPACRTTLVATRFWVVMICPIIKCLTVLRVFFYFVWFMFIHHNFQFYFELCTYCNILDIYLS